MAKPEEIAWLVERASPATPEFLSAHLGEWAWTNDHLKALRFAREEDAKRVLAVMVAAGNSGLRATEHIWS
jgi:hypothetical protein